jgi:GTPase
VFVDEVDIRVAAGNGGNGCLAFRREKRVPRGGPSGGDGGHGGSIFIVASAHTNTLINYRFHPEFDAKRGQHGMGSNCTGHNGEDLELAVPIGTLVYEKGQNPDEPSRLLADLQEEGQRVLVAQGGHGGRGNARFASSTNRAPRRHEPGGEGEQKFLRLELKLLADVGLVGFPNAGKSTMIARISAARPKIADYPFTTLVPNLGVVQAGESRFTVADVPGLVRGASEGRGLGLEFLRHVERCTVLVHVIDCATMEPDRDPVSDLEAIEDELAAYDETDLGGIPLHERPRIVALNKADVPDARELAEMVKAEIEARGVKVLIVSAATREGLRELQFAMAELVEQARAAKPHDTATRIVLRPRAVDDAGFTVTRVGTQFFVRGERPERWIKQTDFTNDEAVGYLADRLNRLGVEVKLAEAGAEPGAEVVIGDVSFDWEPGMLSGSEHRIGPRGTDARLDGR